MAEKPNPDESPADFAVEFYWQMRGNCAGRVHRDTKRRQAANARAERSKSEPFQPGRDPVSMGDTLAGLVSQFAWDTQLSEAELFANWGEIVGEGNATNSQPESLTKGLLLVRCSSTAWATSLRLMDTQILTLIQEKHPTLAVERIKFVGPDAPSWKKGKLSVPGRGPRDTYG